MAMSEFEKKLIAELKGIKDELRKLNKKEALQGQIDGVDISMGALINNSLRANSSAR